MLPKAKKTLRTAAPAAAAVSTKTPMECSDVAHENLEAVWPQYEIGHILTRGNIALQKTENQHFPRYHFPGYHLHGSDCGQKTKKH